MTKLLLAALLGVAPVAATAMPIIYDVTLTGRPGTSSGGLSGAGVVTFADNAFDVDGIFALSHGVTDFSMLVDGVSFGLGDLKLTDPHFEYQVLSNTLIGFDLTARNALAEFGNNNAGVGGYATPLTSMVIYQNIAPAPNCYAIFPNECGFDVSWAIRPQSVPEPASMSLFGAGILALVLARRRRARAATPV